MTQSMRDPRTYVLDPVREGLSGHPGFGRTKPLYGYVTPNLYAEAEQLAEAAGLTLNDLLNNALSAYCWGPLQPVSSPAPIEPTLTAEEAYQHLDPEQREGESKQAITAHFEALAPVTLAVLEREEDKVDDTLYSQALSDAEHLATITRSNGDAFGKRVFVGVNQARYAVEIARAKEKRQEREQRKQAYRRQRRALLGAAAMVLATPALRQPGDPRGQRQYHQPSRWDTDGSLTREDIRQALKKDSS